MGWWRDLAEKVVPAYNPETDWWMKGVPPPPPTRDSRPQTPGHVVVITQEDEADNGKSQAKEERNTRVEAQEEARPADPAPWQRAQEAAAVEPVVEPPSADPA